MESISGIFDVHITVNDRDLYNFNRFCADEKLEIVYAVGKTGEHRQQLMTSHVLSKTTAKEAIAWAEACAKKLRDHNILVLRVKVETLAKSPSVGRFLSTADFRNCAVYYFEFHFKVRIACAKDQERLEALCEKTPGVSYAVNLLSRKNREDPLITYRVRSARLERALEQREVLITEMSAAGLQPLMDGTHYEFTVYDTCPSLDRGLVPDPVVLPP